MKIFYSLCLVCLKTHQNMYFIPSEEGRPFKEIPSKINQSYLIRKSGSFSLFLSLSLFPSSYPFFFSLSFSPSSFLSPSLSLCPFLLLSFFPLASPPPYPTPLKNSNGRNAVYLRLKVLLFLPNRHPAQKLQRAAKKCSLLFALLSAFLS